MPWIELNELELKTLRTAIKTAIDTAGDKPAPKVMALCDLYLKIQRSELPDRDLDDATIEIATSIRNQAALEPDISVVTWDCALNIARNIVNGIELYGRKA